ncbi:MAG: DNA polymerase III subunit delta' [Pseudomonadota bacterium]
MADDQPDIPIADRIDGLLQPFEHGMMIGQDDAEGKFIEAQRSGRLHHAWLLCGERGIGKATFAFRLARHFVELNDETAPLTSNALDEAADPNSRVFRQVAHGAHQNILHLRVPLDEKTGRFKTRLTVDEVRRTVSFFGSTRGENGFRICLVDSVDQMNVNAANALLKILEEPPERTLFFLLSERPGRLLPTIRSRCRKLDFGPLDVAAISKILDEVADEPVEATVLERHRSALSGSVRRAFLFARHGNDEIKQAFDSLVSNANPPTSEIHRFADVISARGEDERYAFFIDFLEDFLRSRIATDTNLDRLVSCAEVWEKVHDRLRTGERYNLDRKQLVLSVFHELKSLPTGG